MSLAPLQHIRPTTQNAFIYPTLPRTLKEQSSAGQPQAKTNLGMLPQKYLNNRNAYAGNDLFGSIPQPRTSQMSIPCKTMDDALKNRPKMSVAGSSPSKLLNATPVPYKMKGIWDAGRRGGPARIYDPQQRPLLIPTFGMIC